MALLTMSVHRATLTDTINKIRPQTGHFASRASSMLLAVRALERMADWWSLAGSGSRIRIKQQNRGFSLIKMWPSIVYQGLEFFHGL